MAHETVGQIIDENPYFPYWDKFRPLLPIKEGGWFKARITRAGKPKTLQQLAYYHAVILPCATQCFVDNGYDVDGVPVCEEQIDYLLKAKCGGSERKRDMTIAEASAFMQNCIDFVANRFGVAIEPPRQGNDRRVQGCLNE